VLRSRDVWLLGALGGLGRGQRRSRGFWGRRESLCGHLGELLSKLVDVSREGLEGIHHTLEKLVVATYKSALRGESLTERIGVR